MTTLKGTINTPFRTMFADTVNTHGVQWAHTYYVRKHGMSQFEFRIWMRSIRLH